MHCQIRVQNYFMPLIVVDVVNDVLIAYLHGINGSATLRFVAPAIQYPFNLIFVECPAYSLGYGSD